MQIKKERNQTYRYSYTQLVAIKPAKAPGQDSVGTGGQNSIGANNIWETLEANSEKAVNFQIADTTILEPDITNLKRILQGYGDAQYLKATSELQAWYETYRWKVGTPKSNSSSDEPQDEAESV